MTQEYNQSLGEFILSGRESLGCNKVEFAKLIGVCWDTIRYWERDRFIPAGKNMYSLVRVLGMKRPEIDLYFKGKYYG